MLRATQSELLEQRITENASSQAIDLATWIFDRVRVRPGDRILELCCGTGAQTLPMLDCVGDDGAVVALDISRSALDALVLKTPDQHRQRLTCVEGSLEDFPSALCQAGVRLPNTEVDRARVRQDGFDLIFCAYGLYYSSDARRTLQEARSHLRTDGRIVVVGPFGPNNGPLFDLVRASGVVIAEPVVFSSESFMLQTVLPWATRNFASVSVHTMVNPVRWTTPDRILNYWQNTTFYEAGKREEFEKRVRAHFSAHPVFVNEKWVMLAEMSNVRF